MATPTPPTPSSPRAPLPPAPAPHGEHADAPRYALALADEVHGWYQRAATRSKRLLRTAETLHLLVAAAIPVTAVVRPGDARGPAVLGGVVVVLAGLRPLFHWQDDYARFGRARSAVEAERRMYRIGAEPYDDPATRDRLLVTAVTRVQQQETATWARLVADSRQEARRPADAPGEAPLPRNLPPGQRN